MLYIPAILRGIVLKAHKDKCQYEIFVHLSTLNIYNL